LRLRLVDRAPLSQGPSFSTACRPVQ
jgi:hypothetical protein